MTHNYSLLRRLLRSMRITSKTKPQRTNTNHVFLSLILLLSSVQIIASTKIGFGDSLDRLFDRHSDNEFRNVIVDGHLASDSVEAFVAFAVLDSMLETNTGVWFGRSFYNCQGPSEVTV